MAGWLSAVAQIGDVVGGFATLGGLVFAVVSVNRWRRDRLDEKRAEAAARAYLALSRACDRLAMWAGGCASFLKGHRSDGPVAGEALDMFRAHNEQGQEIAREAISGLRELAESMSVYLDDSEMMLLLEAGPIWDAIRVDAAPIGATGRQLSDAMIDKMCARFQRHAAGAVALFERASVLREVGRYRRGGGTERAAASAGGTSS
jgi:hypothetical protein